MWAIQMCALVGAPAYSVMTGISTRAAADSKRGHPLIEEWDHLNSLAVMFIIVSCPSAVTHNIADCNHNAHTNWTKLQRFIRTTDAEGAFCLLMCS